MQDVSVSSADEDPACSGQATLSLISLFHIFSVLFFYAKHQLTLIQRAQLVVIGLVSECWNLGWD